MTLSERVVELNSEIADLRVRIADLESSLAERVMAAEAAALEEAVKELTCQCSPDCRAHRPWNGRERVLNLITADRHSALDDLIAEIHQDYQTGAAYERLVSAQVDALTQKYRDQLDKIAAQPTNGAPEGERG